MGIVFLSIGLLLLLSLAAGAVVFRFFGRHIPTASRLALMPVIGAAVLCLLCFLAFLFVPLGPTASKVVYLPLFGWLVLRVRRRAVPSSKPKTDRGRRPRRPTGPRERARPTKILRPVLALFVLAGIVVTAPFFLAGGPEGLGIHNNDLYYFASHDWRVSMHTFFGRGPVPFSIDPDSTWVKRWGVDYLSVFLRHTTGLRSYQTVQLSAAFGLFLTACATFALARAARLHWAVAVLGGVVAAGNHFSYKLYVDGMLGFTFGMPFAVALVALLVRRVNSVQHGVLVGLAAAGMILSYYELVPAVGLVVLVSVAARFRTRWPWKTILTGSAIAIVVSTPFLAPMLEMFRYAAAVRFVTDYFHLSKIGFTVAHLLGTVDLFQYHFLDPQPTLWQYAGAALVAYCLIRARWKNPVSPAVVVAVAFGAYLLLARDLQYQANRMFTIGWIFLSAILFSWCRSSKHFAVAAVTTAVLLGPSVRLANLAARSHITTSPAEREIGEWLAKLPTNAKLLIDAPEDGQIWHSHWMYLEAVHAFGGDDSRIVIPHIKLSYVEPVRPTADKADYTGVTHILRRNVPGQVYAEEALLASNADYRLFAITRPMFLVWGPGFLGLEGSGASWMAETGTLIINVEEAGTKTLTLTTWANPSLGSTAVTVLVNGSPAAKVEATQTSSPHSISVVLNKGRNEIVLRSDRPPAALGPVDRRMATVYVGGVRVG